MDEGSVIQFLKTTRKTRKQATCYPCQRRKVKCDRGSPCRVCVARGHPFLCSYGRPSEGSSITRPDVAMPIDSPGTVIGDTATVEPSEISVLRKELERLRYEVRQTRMKHRRCQATRVKCQRLRARCHDFEVAYTSLKAGNWAALSQLDKTMESPVETDGESSTCSRSRNGSDAVNLAQIQNGRMTTCDLSQQDHRNHKSRLAPIIIDVRGKIPACDETSRIGRAPSLTPSDNHLSATPNLRLTHSLDNLTLKHAAMPLPTAGTQVKASPQHPPPTNDKFSGTLPPVSLDQRAKQQPSLREIPEQCQTPSQMILPDNSHAVKSWSRSTTAAASSSYPEQISQTYLGANYSGVGNGSEIVSNLLTSRAMNDFTDSLCLPDISCPPMAFTHHIDLMERSYAEYCSRMIYNVGSSLV